MVKECSRRNKGIDVLRIFLMWMVVIHHAIVHGFGIYSLNKGISPDFSGGGGVLVLLGLNAFVIPAVNTFFLISGFFGINSNLKKVFRLLFQTMFYIILCSVLVFVFSGEKDFHQLLKQGMYLLAPFVKYWYIAAYLLLCLLAPYINLLLEHLNDRKLLYLVILLFFINSICGFVFEIVEIGRGYSISQAVFLYIFGRYLGRKQEWRINLLWGYLLSTFLIALSAITLFQINKYELCWRVFSYNNPLVIFSGICLLGLGLRIKLSNQILEKISSKVLGAYLLTDYAIIRPFIFSILLIVKDEDAVKKVFFIVAYAGVLLLIGVIVELLRQKLFKNLEDNTWRKINAVFCNRRKWPARP